MSAQIIRLSGFRAPRLRRDVYLTIKRNLGWETNTFEVSIVDQADSSRCRRVALVEHHPEAVRHALSAADVDGLFIWDFAARQHPEILRDFDPPPARVIVDAMAGRDCGVATYHDGPRMLWGAPHGRFETKEKALEHGRAIGRLLDIPVELRTDRTGGWAA